MQKENDSFPSGESDVLAGLPGRCKYPVAFWSIHKYAALSGMCQQPPEPLTNPHFRTLLKTQQIQTKTPPLHLCMLRLFQISTLPYLIVLGHCLKYKSLHPSLLIHSCSCYYWFCSPLIQPALSIYIPPEPFHQSVHVFSLPNIPSFTPSSNRPTLSIRKSMWLRWATKVRSEMIKQPSQPILHLSLWLFW